MSPLERGNRSLSSVFETLSFMLSKESATHRQLLVVGEEGTTRVRVPATGEITIGRAAECTVRLVDARASRLHATLSFGDQVTIVDHGSTNGTHVGERAIEPGEATVVEPGVVVRIGLSTLVLQGCVPSPRPRRLHSHGYFETRLEEECLRAEASGTTFTVVRLRCDAVGARVAEEGFANWLAPSTSSASTRPTNTS